MSGVSYRVPTLDGSFSNLYFNALYNRGLGELTAETINDMIRAAVSRPKYARRICVFEGEDAGTFDIIGKRENAVFVPSKTIVLPMPELTTKTGKQIQVYLV